MAVGPFNSTAWCASVRCAVAAPARTKRHALPGMCCPARCLGLLGACGPPSRLPGGRRPAGSGASQRRGRCWMEMWQRHWTAWRAPRPAAAPAGSWAARPAQFGTTAAIRRAAGGWARGDWSSSAAQMLGPTTALGRAVGAPVAQPLATPPPAAACLPATHGTHAPST